MSIRLEDAVCFNLPAHDGLTEKGFYWISFPDPNTPSSGPTAVFASASRLQS